MSIEILEQNGRAVMICTTTDWAFGPVFDGKDEVLSFLQWLKANPQPDRMVTRLLGLNADDPRSYDDGELERLYLEWLNRE